MDSYKIEEMIYEVDELSLIGEEGEIPQSVYDHFIETCGGLEDGEE